MKNSKQGGQDLAGHKADQKVDHRVEQKAGHLADHKADHLAAPQVEQGKLNYPRTFLIGFGFFASSLIWSLYNSFVPLILGDFIESTAIIGFIMTVDNIFGVIFQPYFGSLSDRTKTRWGQRMPYILLAAPVSALFFFLIPQMPSLWLLMAVIVIFNFSMSVWRSPMISLMPDLTPNPHWSRANGVINLMGGVGSIVAFLIGGRIANAYGRGASFAMGSLVTMLAVIILAATIKENRLKAQLGFDHALGKDADDQPHLSSFTKLPAQDRHKLLALLLAIFFWFCAYNAVETFFTSFATNDLGLSEGTGAMTLSFFSLSFVIFAIPSGLLASKIGRERAIIIGLVGLILVFLPINFVMNLWAIRILLLIGGFFWALININSLPMVLSLGKREAIGTYTGYYYFFSFSAAIASPILFGAIRDLTQDYGSLFIYAPICFALALASILTYDRLAKKALKV